MKIKEFSIRHYGPLPDLGKIVLGNFTLFWGKNEEGKTLTIDALVKLLLGQNLKDFKNINRVDENPEGYVIIEEDNGKKLKLPEKGKNLTKITGLTSSECRNIFIIRNSDLSITDESQFYTNVTDKLTGLRTKEISKIKETLYKIGKITAKGDFKDTQEDGKLKTNIEKAKHLIKEIENLNKEIKQKKLDEFEENLIKKKEEIEEIKQRIKLLEDARNREKYEKGKEALDELEKSLKELENLKIYNEEEERTWRDCERDIKNYNEEKEELLEELKKKENELNKINEKLSELEKDFKILDGRKKILDEDIKPRLKNYEEESKKLAQNEVKSKFFARVGIISAILLGISLLGLIFRPSLLFYIMFAILSILTLISGIFKFKFVKDESHLKGMLEKIKLDLSKFELSAENIEGILSKIQNFDDEYNEKNSALQKIRINKEKLENEINKLQNEKIPSIENKIKEAEVKINEIKIKTKVDFLGEYSEKLKLKQEFEQSVKTYESILKSHFGEKGKKLEENISYWDKEIQTLEEYKDKAKDIRYRDADEKQLKNKQEDLVRELESINKTIESLREKMKDIERKANEILRLEKEFLRCETSIDLEAVKNKLKEFIELNENNKNNALEVIRIFEEIEREEKEKVSDLFGKESPVSKYFSEITDGLYEEVNFNQETGKIEVKRKDGITLEAEKLSGGAYDQLYFSIRLALGEKLLKGKKGFFILDDPFIKSDPDRLQRQIEMLKKISRSGWQVIYFSAKSEIKDILKEDIKNNFITFLTFTGVTKHPPIFTPRECS